MKKYQAILILSLSLTSGLLAACHDSVREAALMEQQKFDTYNSDAILTSQVESKLLADESLHALNIKVSTTQGVVSLYGHVPNREIKHRVTKIAVSTHGVVGVNNDLKIVE